MAHKPKSAPGDWQKQLRFDMAFAEKTLVKDGHVERILVVHTKEGRFVIPGAWNDPIEKRALLDTVRAMCMAHDAQALSFISEAWVRVVERRPGETKAELQARSEEVRPRDAEDRREVVIVMCLYRDGAGERQVISETREVQRRANGKPSGLTPFGSYRGEDIMGGDVVEVFPEFPPSKTQQHAARMMLHLAGMGEPPN